MAERNSTDKKVIDWLSKQYRNPNDKITNWQKLTSPFLPPDGVTTWGQWFQSAGISAPRKKTEQKKVSSKNYESQVFLLEKQVSDIRYRISLPSTSAEERKKLIEDFKTAQDKLRDAKSDFINAEVEEGRIEEAEAEERAAENLRFEIRTLRERKKLEQELGLRTTEVDSALREKESQLGGITQPRTTGVRTGEEAVPQGVEMFLSERGTTSAIKPKKVKDTGVAGAGGVGQGSAGTAGAAGAGTAGTRAVEDDQKKPKKTSIERYEDAVALATEKYNMPDIIFNNVPSLGAILKDFADGKISRNGFITRVQNDNWYRQNSETIRNRYLELFNFEDLQKRGAAVGTSAFEQELQGIAETIQNEALDMMGSRITDDDAVQQIAKDLYIYGLDKSPTEIRQRIAKFLRPTASMVGTEIEEGFGGEAKANYDALLATARANGFQLKDILPKDAEGKPLETAEVLRRIATGKMDTNRIQDDIRRLASQGMPDYVKDLLAQGNDLDAIYAPYRQKMASVLEITDPLSIDLKDPSLQMAISKDGDMNLFDYEKSLRKDKRWQYTESARDEAADALDTILKDFGFRR